jgi:O-antigen/teichoic acid export membrane protein
VKAIFHRLCLGMRSRSFRNVLYVGAVQLVTLLIPLATGPWILRALQPSAYGKYALALAIIQYGVILVDFGFYLAATQRIAQIRDDRAQLTRYFWTVQSARFLLAIIGVIITIGIVIAVPKFWPIVGVAAAYSPVLLGTLLYPQWLFLGLERIKVVSLANISARLLSAVPIFILVRSPNDAAIAAFLAASNYLAAGIISFVLIAVWKLVDGFELPRRSEIIAVYKDAWPLFLTVIAFSLYSTSNTVILGVVRSSYEVGLFGAADKLRSVALTPINSISTVFFPRISRMLVDNRAKAINTLTIVAIILGVGTACISITLFLGAPLLIQLFAGHTFAGAAPVVRILSIVPFLVGLNTAFGPLAMVNLGMKKECSRIILVSGVINIALLFLLGTLYGARGAAMSLATTEALVTAWMAATLHRKGFLREAAQVFSSKLRSIRSS